MVYPLISEYLEAIRSAEDNFKELTSLRPVLDSNGDPVMSSGNFAVVFKMKDEKNGKHYAVKCFIKEQESRKESYKKIADELDTITSPYILSLRYLEKELFVDSKQCEQEELPVVVMEWVEGETLDTYLRKKLHDPYELAMLGYRFNQMAAWLLSQPFAHGDLKPDNILVRKDGSLVLVDYDGMFVPAMKGEKAREMGSPDYRHPLRTEADFNEHIDDFSISVIALSLKAISLKPELRSVSDSSDTLLLKEEDFRDSANSAILKELLPLITDKDFKILWGVFWLALAQNTLDDISFRLFRTEKPKESDYIIEPIRTNVTDEDRAEAIEDEYGVLYSPDGKRLIEGNTRLNEYTVKPGTLVICDDAFSGCTSLECINISDSVTSIGWRAFIRCTSLESVNIPDSVTSIGWGAFFRCTSLKSVNIPDTVTSIGKDAFSGCTSLESVNIPDTVTSIGDHTFYDCTSLKSVNIPDSVTSIGMSAFSGCTSLESINIPDTVTYIGANPFSSCNIEIFKLTNNPCYKVRDGMLIGGGELKAYLRNQKEVEVPDTVTSIGGGAFEGCTSLENINIPDTVTSIGRAAFSDCTSLESVNIPDSVTAIEPVAFSGCTSLKSVNIPDTVTSIGDYAFYDCTSLKSVNIPDTVTSIGDYAFYDCTSLKSVNIPDTVTSIGDYAFYDCTSLKSVNIPDSVTSIGEGAFSGCTSLESINIPDTVTYIGANPFSSCNIEIFKLTNNPCYKVRDGMLIGGGELKAYLRNQKEVEVPDSVTSIGTDAFYNCTSLESVNIPDSVTSIAKWAFEGCTSLKFISISDNASSKLLEDCVLPPHCEVVRRKS